ncbi:MDR family MFS transporter [Actinosynnema pretiosum]|uniref:MFS transporter n=1 Tax=Actinosynnema pretiosum TaxID=42197 RepID=A0A290ZAD8_9PSEU|nr:MDR family MFS transporter [Actinosynnema pretiosum]ATE55968.1 MFS transporter [Actinosynnema pretiosum]
MSVTEPGLPAPRAAQDDGHTAAPPSLSKARVNVIFGVIVLGMLLAALDQTIVATALPTIVGEVGGAGHMSWVVTSYILAETVATVLAGKFGDLFGRKAVFQVSVVVFIVGSFFCGAADTMGGLIAMRALQGIGGGGIAVTATALIADVIPLRERGKYQGALGAVFGVTTVVGPLLGGLFTDHLSWRWAFYVNVPLALAVIALAARAIPGAGERGKPRIDYWGAALIALGASGLTLATTWGGTEHPWGSATIIGLFAGSAVALALFVVVENRVPEPILPMRLFRGKVFAVASLLSFIVGFAMMGALTFLPSYLQYVSGASATSSGLRTLPMVLGLLITALLSGQVVGATGRYRPFPIAGAAVTAVGMHLLSTLDPESSIAAQSLAMFVLGAGIGLVMQVLTIVVQNTADYRDLGAATSGVTFFRSLGSSFGASIMGTVYANRLAETLPPALAQTRVPPAAITTPEALHALPDAARQPIVTAYADALHTVFLAAVPIALLGLLVAFLLPQVEIRGTAREAARGAGEGFAMPTDQHPDTQLENLIGRVAGHNPDMPRQVLARSGLPLELPAAWALLGIHLRAELLGERTRQSDVEDQVGLPHGVLTSFYDALAAEGHLTRTADGHLALTPAASTTVTALIEAWTAWLLDQLADWTAQRDPDTVDGEVRAAVRRITRRLMLEQQRELQRG